MIESLADLEGPYYVSVLKSLHDTLAPKTYFEVGSLHGDTLALAKGRCLAVDPDFRLSSQDVLNAINANSRTILFRSTSDQFFAENTPTAFLGGAIDFAFLDGMHRCEFLLRDFYNTERHCKPNSVIALHDCLPVEVPITSRDPFSLPAQQSHRQGWWTGDVWRTALLLKRRRPDLVITTIDSQATGLILITNLDPTSRTLERGYQDHVRAMLSWDLAEIGIAHYFNEMQIEPCSVLSTPDGITARFWL